MQPLRFPTPPLLRWHEYVGNRHRDRSRWQRATAFTIGLLLCKTRNHLVAEYALSAPRSLPRQSDSDDGLDTCLPSIEQIEAELGRIGDEESGTLDLRERKMLKCET